MFRTDGNITLQLVAGLFLLGILVAGLKFRSKNLFAPGEFYPGGTVGHWYDPDHAEEEDNKAKK